eukprot:jgi/Psemu1/20611/gm1.20611_g
MHHTISEEACESDSEQTGFRRKIIHCQAQDIKDHSGAICSSNLGHSPRRGASLLRLSPMRRSPSQNGQLSAIPLTNGKRCLRRTVLDTLKDPAVDRGLSPVDPATGTQCPTSQIIIRTNVEERYPELKLSAPIILDLDDPAKLKQPSPHHGMKVEELEFSPINLQLAAIKLIIGERSGNHNSSSLMEANSMFVNDPAKLKAQPAGLPKDDHDKATQLFKYHLPDLSELSCKIHKAILFSLGNILDFFKAW